MAKVNQYIISISLRVNTSGGKLMAKRIFSNMIKSDPYHPIQGLKVRELSNKIKR